MLIRQDDVFVQDLEGVLDCDSKAKFDVRLSISLDTKKSLEKCSSEKILLCFKNTLKNNNSQPSKCLCIQTTSQAIAQNDFPFVLHSILYSCPSKDTGTITQKSCILLDFEFFLIVPAC